MSKSYERFLPDIEKKLESSITADNSAAQAMKYSLLSGGKRIRPILLLEFYALCGGMGGSALNFAAALEMIHTYSLIHDDLPCMDNDDMRRGRPSCHKAFGEDTALLAGDALLTLAFKTAAETDGIPSDRVLKAIAVLAENAGISGMVGGQVEDLAFEKSGATIEQLRGMYLKKTSCLLSAAAVCGSILAGADDEELKYAAEYAEKLGLAFQIIDDILDCTSDEKTLGKPIGSDEKNGKTTYVTLLGIDGAKAEAERLSNEALTALCKIKGDNAALRELTADLLDRKF
mgnify:FL=1